MEEIIKLIDITRKKGQRSIQLVNQNFRKKEISKDNLLYEGIVSGKFSDDWKAAKDIFKSDPGNRNYRNAKSKLKEKLLNHLFFLDYEKENCSYYEKSQYECLHAIRQCKVLVSEGEIDLASKLLPYWMKVASDLELLEVLIDGLTILRNYYASVGKITFFDDTEKELKKYQILQYAVWESECIYNEAIVHLQKSVSAQSKILPLLPERIKILYKKASDFKSTNIYILAAKLNLLYNSLSGNFEGNLKLCNEIEKKFLEKPNSQIKVCLKRSEICFIKLQAYFAQRQYSEGSDYAEKNLHLFRNGSDNWFRFIEYFFLILMKSGRYKKAGELYRKVRTSKFYNSQTDDAKQRWQIYRASVLFMHDTKLLRWGFDLEEFVNGIPAFSKEQHSINVVTLVLQFFYLMREEKIDDMKVRLKELQKYNSFHLDKRNNYRNSLFIRMLSLIFEKEFNTDLIEEKSCNYFNKLSTTFITNSLKDDMEVIPYETLWKYLIQLLKSNKYYLHYKFYSLNLA